MWKIIAILSSTLMLITGCNEKLTYADLMQHPERLKKAVARCEASSMSDSDECDIVEQASKDFSELLSQQQTNPERFGQDLMDQEIACAKAKKDKDADEARTIKVCQKVKVMLAVIGQSPPE